MENQRFLIHRATALARSFMGLPTVAIVPDGDTRNLAGQQGAKAGVGQPAANAGRGTEPS